MSSSSSSCCISSGTGRTAGRTRSANRASTPGSTRSAFASCPVARAKSRTWRGFVTTTGSPAAASAATAGTSYPPVASSTTSAGPSRRSRSTSVRSPRSSVATAHRSSAGRLATTSSTFATSIPTNPPPCAWASVIVPSWCVRSVRRGRPRLAVCGPVSPRSGSGSARPWWGAAPANARCLPPRPHRAGAPTRMPTQSARH